MPIAVRPLRADEGRIYLEIVNSAIRGLAVSHYPSDTIDGWVVPVTDETVRDLMLNAEHEGSASSPSLTAKQQASCALIVERFELRACYVSPPFARRGCGSALVHQISVRARKRD